MNHVFVEVGKSISVAAEEVSISCAVYCLLNDEGDIVILYNVEDG
jgi:hypothetical protein